MPKARNIRHQRRGQWRHGKMSEVAKHPSDLGPHGCLGFGTKRHQKRGDGAARIERGESLSRADAHLFRVVSQRDEQWAEGLRIGVLPEPKRRGRSQLRLLAAQRFKEEGIDVALCP